MPEEKMKAVLRPVRSDSYELRFVTGFAMHPHGENAVVLDTFVDLPPLGMAKINPETGEEAPVVERRYISGFLLSRQEIKKLGEQLLEAAKRMES